MCQNIHGLLLYKNIEKTPTISEIWREGKREREKEEDGCEREKERERE